MLGLTGPVAEHRAHIKRLQIELSYSSLRTTFQEQVANPLCAQANSVSYPQRDRKGVVAYLM